MEIFLEISSLHVLGGDVWMLQKATKLAAEAAGQDRWVSTSGDTDQVAGAWSLFLRQLPSRYGNPAYRDWFASLENEGEQLLAEVVAGTGKEG